jgi:hypothetical protein
MDAKGLDANGYIAREGSLAKVSPEFAPVVSALRAELPAAFPPARLHSAYLYGSIPRGTAGPGVSDLDVLVALRGEPGDADADAARALEAGLDARFPGGCPATGPPRCWPGKPTATWTCWSRNGRTSSPAPAPRVT